MTATSIPARLPDGWQGSAFRGLAGGALLAELPLVWHKLDGSSESRFAGLLVFLALGIPLLCWKIKFPGWLHMGVAAGTAGGAAMLAGDLLDQSHHAGSCCCWMPGAGPSLGLHALASWSSGLMMLACVVSSLLLCPGAPFNWLKPVACLKHLGCFGGMWAGMSLGGHWLLPGLVALFGQAGGLHLAMVTGMMVGAGLSHMLFWGGRI